MLTKAGMGNGIQATSGSLASAIDSNITVTPGAAAQLLITPRSPFSVTSGKPFSVTVAITDAFSNTVTGYTGVVSLSLFSNPSNAPLHGTVAVTAQRGRGELHRPVDHHQSGRRRPESRLGHAIRQCRDQYLPARFPAGLGRRHAN